jgi:2-dehydropantoate 2-reductase
MENLNWLIFGAGAIGTYIGGALILSGHVDRRLVFVERPDIAARIGSQPFRLDLLGRTSTIPYPRVVPSLSVALQSGAFDVSLLALKSYDTQAFLDGLGELVGRLPPVLCLQNGVENEDLLANALGKERVISGTVTSAVGRLDAGHIVLERRRGIGVTRGHPLSERIYEEFIPADLNPRLYARPLDMKWSKMLTNLLANASSAILNLTPAQIFAHPGLFNLERQQLLETLKVMKKLGIRVVSLPGTPVRLLAFAVKALPAPLSRPLLQRAVGKGRGEKMPSFHIDLYAGRKQSEVDYLNGAVVRFGARVGVPTPVNQLLNETLLALASGDLPLETYALQPEKLLNRFSPRV